MGVVCIAELIYECSGVFQFVEGTIWILCVSICNAWFVYYVLSWSLYLFPNKVTMSSHPQVQGVCPYLQVV